MTTAVWVVRLLLAAVFIFSGVSKAIDPWGFIYKMHEYLGVWHIAISRQILLCFAMVLSAAEFTCGVLVAIGSLRRVTLWVMSAMMVVMLPLTIYIAIANPVADCGCFGEALIISNTATLIKNIVIVLLLAWLWYKNTAVRGIVGIPLQWLVTFVSVGYCFTLSYIGYDIQPLVDFRPYHVGTSILGDADDDDAVDNIKFVYAKDGRQMEFTAENLPDTTWTFVERVDPQTTADAHAIMFYDGEDEVAQYIIERGTPTPTLLLLISDPGAHDLTRSQSANRLYKYVTEQLDGTMIAVVACHPDSIDTWRRHVGAQYDAYSAEDTMVKEIARGVAALVYLHGDTIIWKRNMLSLPPDFPSEQLTRLDSDSHKPNALETVKPVDDMRLFPKITLYYILAMVLIFALNLVPALRRD